MAGGLAFPNRSTARMATADASAGSGSVVTAPGSTRKFLLSGLEPLEEARAGEDRIGIAFEPLGFLVRGVPFC